MKEFSQGIDKVEQGGTQFYALFNNIPNLKNNVLKSVVSTKSKRKYIM